MPLRFLFLLITVNIYFFSTAQEKKINNYIQKIITNQDRQLKEKYFDSLSSILYKCNCNTKKKLQYLNRIIRVSQNNEREKTLYFKAGLFKAKLYFRQSEFQKAIDETEALKTYCKQTNNTKGLIRTNILQGRIYNRIDQYDSALTNYQSTLSLFNKIDINSDKKLQKILITLYANLARLYMNMHQDSLADVYHIKTVNLAYKIHDYERISFFNNILGWKYFVMNDYKTAEQYFLKALQDSAKIKLKIYNISNHHALGEVYEKLKKPQKALYHDSIALNFFIKTNNNTFISTIYNNMANVYLQTGQLDKALISNRNAITIAEQHKITDKIITGKLTLAEILIAQQKYDEALKLLIELLKEKKYAEKLKARYKKLYYKLLADIYAIKNDYQKAYRYINLHLKYTDSINQRKFKSFSGTETKYQKELLKKRMLIKQQELNTQKKQKQKLIYSVIFLTVLIFTGILLGFWFYKKYKTNLKEYNLTLQKIEKLNTVLFQQKQNTKPAVNINNFKNFLKEKYNIYKIEVLDVWISIANGLSQYQYAQNNHISENTVKAWRKELYKKLKQHTGDTKFSDYKAVIEYYKSLRDFEYFQTR